MLKEEQKVSFKTPLKDKIESKEMIKDITNNVDFSDSDLDPENDSLELLKHELFTIKEEVKVLEMNQNKPIYKKRKLDYKIMSISGGSVDMRDSSQIAEEAIVVEKVKSAALSLCAPQKGCQKKNRAIPSKLSP